MVKNKSSNLPKRLELVIEFLAELKDPNHRRLLEAYRNDDSVRSMEVELSNILLEIISDED